MDAFWYEGGAHQCMGEVRGPFVLMAKVDWSQAEKWLTFLASQEPFEWKSVGANQYQISLTSYNYSYRVMMGTLLKAVNEHQWMLGMLRYKEPQRDFWPRLFKIFNRFAEKQGWPWMAVHFMSCHSPFERKCNYQKKTVTVPPVEFKALTIKNLFNGYREWVSSPSNALSDAPSNGWSNFPIWKTFLYTIKE